jgi:hypothetical protein
MKHLSDIICAFIEAGHPALGLVALAIHRLPQAALLAALGASFRWHDGNLRLFP